MSGPEGEKPAQFLTDEHRLIRDAQVVMDEFIRQLGPNAIDSELLKQAALKLKDYGQTSEYFARYTQLIILASRAQLESLKKVPDRDRRKKLCHNLMNWMARLVATGRGATFLRISSTSDRKTILVTRQKVERIIQQLRSIEQMDSAKDQERVLAEAEHILLAGSDAELTNAGWNETVRRQRIEEMKARVRHKFGIPKGK